MNKYLDITHKGLISPECFKQQASLQCTTAHHQKENFQPTISAESTDLEDTRYFVFLWI